MGLHDGLRTALLPLHEVWGNERMNTCPNCGLVKGMHGSVLPGCECPWKPQDTERESAYQRGYLDGIGRECPHCKDYKALYIKVRDELAAEQQRNAI